MHPSKKLLIFASIIVLAVLIAVPFRRTSSDELDYRSRQQSQRRWRDTNSNAPIPLRVQSGESPAAELAVADVAAESPGAHAVGPAAKLPVPAPPSLPASYRPLLAPKSSLPEPRVAKAEEPAKGRDVRIVRHTIRDGDTLEKIAARYLGDSRRAGEIYHFNRQRLPSTQALPLHLEIEIPVDATVKRRVEP